MPDLNQIALDLEKIKERNRRVEAEKAWETSVFRLVSIMVVTYIIASLVLFAIGNASPLTNALIPTLGYFLSTLSLPFIKRRWMRRYAATRTGEPAN